MEVEAGMQRENEPLFLENLWLVIEEVWMGLGGQAHMNLRHHIESLPARIRMYILLVVLHHPMLLHRLLDLQLSHHHRNLHAGFARTGVRLSES